MAWTGPNNMEGTVKCGAAQLVLDGNAANLNLTISSNNCSSPGAELSQNLSLGDFKNYTFWSCQSAPVSPTLGSDCSSAAKGYIQSFKVTLPSFFPELSNLGLSSKCHNLSGGTIHFSSL